MGEGLVTPYTWTFSTTAHPQEGVDSCFIATAVFGSPLDKHVVILRKFRDTYFIKSASGRMLVNLYYRYSPPVAHVIRNNEQLKLIVRTGLLPVIAFSYAALHYGGHPNQVLAMDTISFHYQENDGRDCSYEYCKFIAV